MAQILDGLKVSKEVKQEIKEEVQKFLPVKDVHHTWLQFW